MPTIRTFGRFRIDISAEILFRGAEPLPVGRRAVALLRALIERPGVPVSKDVLIEAAWPGLAIEESNLTVQIASLRRVLGEEPGGERWIETLPRRGYRFVGPVVSPADSDLSTRRRPATDLGAFTLSQRQLVISPSPQRQLERRQLTVMCCELILSSASPVDPEDFHDLVAAYHRCIADSVGRFGGFLAGRISSTTVVSFGYPVAREDDSERAVRAALSVQRAMEESNRKNAETGTPAAAVRIAIEAGAVVIDASGEIFGDAPNIAARAQGLAEPGDIVVTARVQRQVAGLFVAERRGTYELKGISEPVSLFRLVRASGGGRRSRQRHLTPLVGRDEEMAMLMRRWEQARQGYGRLVLIVGEPGIGKSRLIEEFNRRLHDTPHTWVEWRCSQLLQNTPLHPIAEWGSHRFGGDDIPAERRLADLDNSLVEVKLDPVENTPLLAPLAGIPLPNERVSTLAPEELRRRQLAALINWVTAGARIQSVVLAVEDLHWADPTTLDLLRGIAERGALAPLLVVATARPEFRAPWGMRSHHATILLAPLDLQQVRRMVGQLASASNGLSQQAVEDVCRRTGGVPLFVEEVTRLLLERGEQGGALTIPPALQQSLIARLDRLGSARELAQFAAVIGCGFSYPLLRAVTGMEDARLQEALERLAESDLVLVQGLPPDSDYRFRHALIRDAAYENLLRSRRTILHRRIAETLRDSFPAVAAAEPEVLAHHFSEAGLIDAAIEWWSKAGQQLLERSAEVEAIKHFSRALARIAKLTVTPARRRKEINLQVALLSPLRHVQGYAAPVTKAAVERALLLIKQAESDGESIDDPLLLFSVLHGSWVAKYVAFDGRAMREQAAQFMELAERSNTSGPRMAGPRLMAMTLLHAGDITQACGHFDSALSLYDPVEHRALSTRFGQDVRVAVLCYRSLALWLIGRPATAVVDAALAVKYAREIGQTATLMYALTVTSLTLMQRHDFTGASMQLRESQALSEEKGAAHAKSLGMMLRGCLAALTGNVSDAVNGIVSAVTAYRSTGATLFLPYSLSQAVLMPNSGNSMRPCTVLPTR
jgi:class 3 adenylate cyclase